MNSLRWAAKPAGLTVGFILIILSGVWLGGRESAKDTLVMVPLLSAFVCVPTGGLALTVGLFLRLSKQFRVAGERVALYGALTVAGGLCLLGIGYAVGTFYGPEFQYP